MMTKRKLYDELGVDEKADAANIKKAYRKKAKKSHPDAGGSKEEFSKVNRAYMILSNPELRSRYDSTGDENLGEVDNTQAQIMAIIAGVMEAAILKLEQRGKNPTEHNLIELMKTHIREELTKREGQIAGLNTLQKKTKKLVGRFKVKKGSNFLEAMITHKIEAIGLNIKAQERDMLPIKAAFDMLMDAEFTFDAGAKTSPDSDLNALAAHTLSQMRF